jgi:hypothetical protein
MPPSRSLCDVALSGLGLMPERPEHPLWSVFLEQAAPRRTSDRSAGAAISAKERRLLSEEDLLGIAAAESARLDAQLTSDCLGAATGCIVASTGKHTTRRERSNYRLAFQRADHTLDGAAMSSAIETGAAHVSPFSLLEGLDNNVLWWICKEHKIATVNLQLVQTIAPGFYAVWEAIELIREGTCRRVIVGGYQTRDQAEVHSSLVSERRSQDAPPDFAGGAIFFVLERADDAAERAAESYGILDVDLSATVGRDRSRKLLCHGESSSRSGDTVMSWLAPALHALAALFRAAIERRTIVLSAKETRPVPSIRFLPSKRAA